MSPNNPSSQLAREWLDRAELDVRLARLALTDSSLSGLAAFHCQQAAEKALKAFLAWHNQPLPKVHDLLALLAACQGIDPALSGLQKAANTLDVYLSKGRYPDAGPIPTETQAKQALELAEQVVAFVANVFSASSQP